MSAVVWAAITIYAFALTHHALECAFPSDGTLRASAKKIVDCGTLIGADVEGLSYFSDPIDLSIRRTGGRRDVYYALDGGKGGYLHFVSIGGTIKRAEITSTIPR